MSIQAQVINLLDDLQDEFDLTYVFIAHDLSVVRHISDRVAVMYLGKLVEVADRDELYEPPDAPVHDGAAVGGAGARPEPARRKRERIRLTGDVPSPINPPPACRFHTRCWKAQEVCATQSSPRSRARAGPPGRLPLPENTDEPEARLRSVPLDTPRPREQDATA